MNSLDVCVEIRNAATDTWRAVAICPRVCGACPIDALLGLGAAIDDIELGTDTRDALKARGNPAWVRWANGEDYVRLAVESRLDVGLMGIAALTTWLISVGYTTRLVYWCGP